MFPVRILAATVLLLSLGACSTAPKNYPTLTSDKTYTEAFSITQNYLKQCFAKVVIRANLYTDIAEAEIIVDELPDANLYFTGVMVISSYERSHEVVNIHFTTEGKGTKITTKSDLCYKIASDALAGKPCQKKD